MIFFSKISIAVDVIEIISIFSLFVLGIVAKSENEFATLLITSIWSIKIFENSSTFFLLFNSLESKSS